MLLSLSALLSAYCDLRFLRLPQRQGIFSSWTQFWTSQVIIHAVYSFIFCFEISFSKLSLAKYHCLRKKPYIFHVFNYYRMSLQISFTNSSVQISSCIKAVLHGKICIVRFDDSYLVNIFIQIWKDRTHPIF